MSTSVDLDYYCQVFHEHCCTVVQERVQLARYCHLPVGNMTGDWILNTADALFARCLRDADHLLWANDPTLPDVAGPANAQVDTSRFLLDQPTMEVGVLQVECLLKYLQCCCAAAFAKTSS